MGQWLLEGAVVRGIAVFLAGLLMVPVQAAAQETGPDWIRCINRDKAVSGDQAIASCTGLLQPDREPVASRAKRPCRCRMREFKAGYFQIMIGGLIVW
jgi:hypothetical protein